MRLASCFYAVVMSILTPVDAGIDDAATSSGAYVDDIYPCYSRGWECIELGH